MIVELGHLALLLALLVAVTQTVIPLVGASMRWTAWMKVGSVCALLQFVLVLASYCALTLAFLRSDFSVALVAGHSHVAKPLLYKLSGVWGNHEGSMLLWVLMVALFGAAAATFGDKLPATLKARVLAVQAAIGVAFLTFVLFSSNPFLRLELPPFSGRDLNPLLQDPGLAFHPPFLYLGYVGLSLTFSFAVAALLEGRVDAAWARWVRPWTLASWVFLTIGIAMGSWWAYYELGWGGWWFWDPVENASFIPWLFATALLHSAIVSERRECLKSWTVLLAILAFSFSLIGTFIVRSGVLTSVHAFASDPTRGVFILAILTVFSCGALTLFALRADLMRPKGAFAPISRESAVVMNNILLVVAALVVVIGTFWPLVAEIGFGRVLSVGPQYFDSAFTPFMVALAAILPAGAMLPWKRGILPRSARGLAIPLGASLVCAATVWHLQTGRALLAPVGIALSTWILLGSMTDLYRMLPVRRIGRIRALGHLAHIPGSHWAKCVAHCGFGLMIMGLSAITAWEIEDIRRAQPGDSFVVGEYSFVFRGVSTDSGPNFRATTGIFAVFRDGKQVANLRPEKRYYPVAGMQTTEAAIEMGLARDIYLVLGDERGDGFWTVRTYIKPLANWIWLGALIMSLGGLISLLDRRYRTAASAMRARVLPTAS